MAVADRNGLPVSVCAESATPHEVMLAVPTLLQMVVPDAPRNLIGDNAYDSDRLDAELRFYGIEVIAPHRRNRKNSTQDGRRLKRYRRRWKIERLFAWLQNFRRLVVRYERHAENFLGMLQLASSLILLRHFMRWVIAKITSGQQSSRNSGVQECTLLAQISPANSGKAESGGEQAYEANCTCRRG
jgi:transposase